MLWVHVPYTKYKNDLVSIQRRNIVNTIMTMMTILMYQNKKINYVVKRKIKRKQCNICM